MKNLTRSATPFDGRRPISHCIVGLALAVGVLCGLTSTVLPAQQVQVEPREIEEPGNASNALFVKETDCDPIPFYLAVNLHFTEVLGKTIIAGTFFELESDSKPTAIAILPTESPYEFWFLTGEGLYGLITVDEDLSVTWIDSLGNSGFIILF